MSPSTILLVSGGGIYLGSVTAAGGIYDSGGHDAAVGTPIVRMQPGFDDVAQMVIAAILPEYGAAVLSATPENGYSTRQLEAARRDIDNGALVSVHDGDRVIFSGRKGTT